MEVAIDHVPAYERITDEASKMAENGASIESIARAISTSWATVNEALDFNRTGRRPVTKPSGNVARKRNGPPKYIANRDEVVRWHGVKNQPLDRIARELSVSEGTVRRA